jgi:hypothetical protein
VRLASGTVQRTLFDSLPCKAFVRMDEMRTFELRHTEVAYKTRQSIASISVESNDLLDLPFGRVVALTCGTINVGYRIIVPACYKVSVKSNFAALQRRKSVSHEDVKRYLANADMFVMGNTDAILAVCPSDRWVRVEE